MIPRPNRKLAVLQGEDMLQFRTGKDLYPYCPDCENSAYTPISGVLGCTIGDDSEVRDYSDRLEAGQTDENTEKCPKFVSKTTSAPGVAAPTTASTVEADMLKTLPPAVLSPPPTTWRDSLEDVLDELPAEDQLLVERLVDNIQKEDKRSQQVPEQDYYYTANDPPKPNKKKSSTAPVSDPAEVEALNAFLTQSGLTTQTPDDEAKRIIAQALTVWQNGLMSLYGDDKLIEAIWDNFRENNPVEG